MNVYVEEALNNDKMIAFNACSYNELIKIEYDDFVRLIKPKVVHILKTVISGNSGRSLFYDYY